VTKCEVQKYFYDETFITPLKCVRRYTFRHQKEPCHCSGRYTLSQHHAVCHDRITRTKPLTVSSHEIITKYMKTLAPKRNIHTGDGVQELGTHKEINME